MRLYQKIGATNRHAGRKSVQRMRGRARTPSIATGWLSSTSFARHHVKSDGDAAIAPERCFPSQHQLHAPASPRVGCAGRHSLPGHDPGIDPEQDQGDCDARPADQAPPTGRGTTWARGTLSHRQAFDQARYSRPAKAVPQRPTPGLPRKLLFCKDNTPHGRAFGV